MTTTEAGTNDELAARDLRAQDFTPGEVVAFRKRRAEMGGTRYAAPEGALATVTGIDWTLWHGALVVQWHDRTHTQSDGGYFPWMFTPHHEQPALFPLPGHTI